MLTIAGGIILAVFGLIAIFVVLGVVISSISEGRPRQYAPSIVPWYKSMDYRKMARQDRVWFAVGIGMVILCAIGFGYFSSR